MTTDYENAQLLLEILQPNFPKNVAPLLKTESFKNESLEYINTLFDTSSTILTSSGAGRLVESDNALDASIQSNQLVNEIAELDSAQNLIEEKLKKTVVNSSNEIIESRLQLNHILHDIDTDFNVQLKKINNALENSVDLRQNLGKNGDVDAEDNDTENVHLASLKALRKNLAKKSALSTLLQNIDSINDILELPSLAGACVKSGYYHETLEISSYTRKLGIRYPNIEVVKKVEDGVKQEIEEMLVGLLKLLKTDLKQSNIVKIISYLKRIYPFNALGQMTISEKRLLPLSNNTGFGNTLKFDPDLLEIDSNALLKRIYLQSRYQFIATELDLLAPLKEHSIEKYLKRVIELIREHCFSSIITYQSVFPYREFADNSDDDDDDEELFSDNDELVHGFIKAVLGRFINIFSANWNEAEEQQTKESLILQTIYCSQSLGRVGGEFSSIILRELQKVAPDSLWFKVLKKQRKLIKSLHTV